MVWAAAVNRNHEVGPPSKAAAATQRRQTWWLKLARVQIEWQVTEFVDGVWGGDVHIKDAHWRARTWAATVPHTAAQHAGATEDRQQHRGVTKLDWKVEMPLAAAWAQSCNSADLECEVPPDSEPTLIVRMKIFTTEQQLDNAQSPIPPPHSPHGPG